MKLYEIFKFAEDYANNFEMRLDLDNLDKFINPSYSSKIGTFDGFDIWGSRIYGDKHDVYCIIDDKNIPIALVVIQTFETLYDGKKCQQIEKVWVNKNNRGKSLTTIILGFIVFKTKTNLISNKLVTVDGKNFYKKLLSKSIFNFYFYDFVKKRVHAHQPEDLFNFPNHYQIILSYDEYSVGDQFNSLHESNIKDLWVFRRE